MNLRLDLNANKTTGDDQNLIREMASRARTSGRAGEFLKLTQLDKDGRSGCLRWTVGMMCRW